MQSEGLHSLLKPRAQRPSVLGHTDYQTTANIYTQLKSEMMKKSSVDMEDVFRRKQDAKSAPAKAQTTRDKRSRKPVLDMSLPRAGKF